MMREELQKLKKERRMILDGETGQLIQQEIAKQQEEIERVRQQSREQLDEERQMRFLARKNKVNEASTLKKKELV